MKYIKNILFSLVAALILTSCGGGGGGGTGSFPGGGGGDAWLIQAAISQNGCGDRIAPVNQEMIIQTSGATSKVDTSIAIATGTNEGGNIVAGYAEAYSGCTRTHTIDIKGLNGGNPEVFLVSETSCDDGQNCVNNWTGTATRLRNRDLQTEVTSEDEGGEKISGESCRPATPEVGYRPSVFECNGAAAVLMRSPLRNNYSVVVRRNGQFNDRDPNNPTCGTNRCSPYKTQKKMELVDYQVNCMGDSGFSPLYDPILRISVKFQALVTNPADTHQFEQYCIPNVEASFN
jgi:hypothetical protein